MNSPKPIDPISIEQLLEDASALLRPSLVLKRQPVTDGESPVGYWGGNGPTLASRREDWAHRVTVDCAQLRRWGYDSPKSLAVFDRSPRWAGQIPVVAEAAGAFESLSIDGGIPLYAHEDRSFPPLEAVCLYGGAHSAEWLASNNLNRWDYDSLEKSRLADRYRYEYEKRCPLYRDDAVAVLGGWHAIWPDDEYYLPREMQLLVWTIADAEPWVEVFTCRSGLSVRHRIT